MSLNRKQQHAITTPPRQLQNLLQVGPEGCDKDHDLYSAIDQNGKEQGDLTLRRQPGSTEPRAADTTESPAYLDATASGAMGQEQGDGGASSYAEDEYEIGDDDEDDDEEEEDEDDDYSSTPTAGSGTLYDSGSRVSSGTRPALKIAKDGSHLHLQDDVVKHDASRSDGILVAAVDDAVQEAASIPYHDGVAGENSATENVSAGDHVAPPYFTEEVSAGADAGDDSVAARQQREESDDLYDIDDQGLSSSDDE